jgi:UDP-N-acetylglucosamine--N-acetylmuramyl-(pentapeptide) pyrophosphoryl-undecaprenol N-acetylglucosamine transferase
MRAASHRPVVIAAGGTGGHFFPAEALAAELIARGERVVLLTDARSSAVNSPVFQRCETHVIPGAGIAGRSVARAAAGAAAIARGVLAARPILKRSGPACVIGFGGYPSVAPLLAARSLRHRPKLVLHDQNAVLGQANALLARLCDKIALSFADTAGVPAGRLAVHTGNPVRPAIVAQAGAPYAPLPAQKIDVLVLGGSLGARVFAGLIPAALAQLPEASRARIRLTMQCPAPVLAEAEAALVACGVQAELSPFFDDVAGLLTRAHLVIGRAGGSTCAELTVIGRPAVLIPLQINADQHANAQALVAAGAAVLVRQTEGPEALGQALEALLQDPARLQAMAQAAAKMGIRDAAVRLADLVAPADHGAAVSADGVKA